jgi:hypothetical protein
MSTLLVQLLCFIVPSPSPYHEIASFLGFKTILDSLWGILLEQSFFVLIFSKYVFIPLILFLVVAVLSIYSRERVYVLPEIATKLSCLQHVQLWFTVAKYKGL